MRVLILDIENMGLDFAIRCAAAGHDVRWWLEDQKLRDGEGFKGFERVRGGWKGHMPWARDGLILCTGNHILLRELDRFRDLGYRIFAPTYASARLEIARAEGMKAMEEAGIQVPSYQTFDSLAAAAKFARKADKPYVFKTMGDEEDKSLSYVASDPADLVGWIEQKIRRGVKMKGACMLQEKIDMLAEVGVSGWFGPDGFLPGKWQACFEHKKLMNGEIGPNTGEQGTVCQYVEADRLAQQFLLPMVGALRKRGHRGDFSIGCGVDKAGKAWPFEFTARCGWPAFFIQTASHKGDPAQWMRDLLDGKDSLKVSNEVAIGVVCAQPRYPYNDSPPDLVEGNPISGLEDAYDDVHCASVMMGRGPRMKDGKIADGAVYETSGEYVLVATGLGKTVERARKKVYGVVDKVKFPNMIYRTDIGEKVADALPALHKFGYATEMAA